MKKITCVLVLVMITALLIPALASCSSTKTIDLNKYVKITTEGYDTLGRLDYTFDRDAFREDWQGKLSINTSKMSSEQKAMVKMLGETGAVDLFLSENIARVSLKEGKTSSLSNGDKVVISVTGNDEIAKEAFNVNLKYSDIEYTVSGLTEVGRFDPFQYVTVTFEGYNPNGRMNVEVNRSIDEMDYINIDYDTSSGLKNGDVIKLTASIRYYESDFVERFGKALEPTEKEITVSGLPDLAKFDPFQYITVTFDGISSDGRMTITKDDSREEMDYIRFDYDKNYGLSNGDVIKVTASLGYYESEFVERFGSTLDPYEKEYTVSGLSTYLSDVSQIPEDTYNKMSNQFIDAFKAHVASEWDYNKKGVKSIDLVGNYTLTPKEGRSDRFNNKVYFMYLIKADIMNEEGETPVPVEYYWYGVFTDVIIAADGSIASDLSEYKVCESYSGWFSSGGDYLKFPELKNQYFAGFATLDDFVDAYMTPNIENFTYTYTEVK